MDIKITNSASSTCVIRANEYHLHIPLYVLDVIRILQDHPAYFKGLKEKHIVEMLEKECFACGDINGQVRVALKELSAAGFVRCINHSYRTLGPFAKLAQARSQRQLNSAWMKITEMQNMSCTSLLSTSSSENYT
ncbi:uncharacterized protein LOC119682440 [Teleopsis dalmanni]|uniref:uncharacterized protein LOC119682440 n=1 Tax=Teleopsis dalmanni TaxID=139649 RepID=UPI000D32C2F0|nr:uncharacterized protein LOC119682440 [Teleopsis dalmanni]